MNARLFRFYFLVALIIASAVLTFFIFRPFLIILVLAAVFAVVLQPLYRSFLARMQTSPGLAAIATLVAAAVCILIPLTFIGVRIAGEAGQLYASLVEGGGKAYLTSVFEYGDTIAARYVPSLALSPSELSLSVDEYIKNILAWTVQNVGGAVGGVTWFLLSLFIFFIALYYLLRDGAKLKQTIVSVSPLADDDDELVFSRLELAINSVIRGSLTIAFIQGILTGIGFTIFGIPNSILWGVIAAFAALIPGIGTSLVLIPGVIYLSAIGAMAPAAGLLVWSLVVVGLIDNFLGPKLVGRGMQLHPLIVLLAVFGGLAFFGPAGIFLGPLCASFLFALLSIYPHLSKQAYS